MVQYSDEIIKQIIKIINLKYDESVSPELNLMNLHHLN